jgi:hypothetical protein
MCTVGQNIRKGKSEKLSSYLYLSFIIAMDTSVPMLVTDRVDPKFRNKKLLSYFANLSYYFAKLLQACEHRSSRSG